MHSKRNADMVSHPVVVSKRPQAGITSLPRELAVTQMIQGSGDTAIVVLRCSTTYDIVKISHACPAAVQPKELPVVFRCV
eukprot:scaffold268693_cov18-Prasinocladus_malaysianus.AAC.1